MITAKYQRDKSFSKSCPASSLQGLPLFEERMTPALSVTDHLSNLFKSWPTLTHERHTAPPRGGRTQLPPLDLFEFPQLLLLSLPGGLVLISSNGCSSYPIPSAFSSSEMLLWSPNAQLVPSHSRLPRFPPTTSPPLLPTPPTPPPPPSPALDFTLFFTLTHLFNVCFLAPKKTSLRVSSCFVHLCLLRA